MKFFLWFIAIIIILRMLGKLLRPLLFAAAGAQMRKMQEQMQNNMQQPTPEQPKQQAPRVAKEGDYIDYEEVR